MKTKGIRTPRNQRNKAVAPRTDSSGLSKAKPAAAPQSLVEALVKGTTPAELAPTKPAASEPEPVVTTVAAVVDVGLGNTVFIRGQGDGLSWERGLPLHCVEASTWLWSTATAKERLVFKLLLNDSVWSRGEDITVEAGERIEVVPVFQ